MGYLVGFFPGRCVRRKIKQIKVNRYELPDPTHRLYLDCDLDGLDYFDLIPAPEKSGSRFSRKALRPSWPSLVR